MKKIGTKIITESKEIFFLLSQYSQVLISLNLESDRLNLSDKLSKYGVVAEFRNCDDSIGFAAYYCNDHVENKAYLSLFAVNPAFQNKGIGTYMLNEIIFDCMNRGMCSLLLEVRVNNYSAIHFYKKNGFVFMGEVDESAKSIFMKKNIGEPI